MWRRGERPLPRSGALTALRHCVGKVLTEKGWEPVYVTSIEGVDETLRWLATDEVYEVTDGIRDNLLDARSLYSLYDQVQAHSDAGGTAAT